MTESDEKMILRMLLLAMAVFAAGFALYEILK